MGSAEPDTYKSILFLTLPSAARMRAELPPVHIVPQLPKQQGNVVQPLCVEAGPVQTSRPKQHEHPMLKMDQVNLLQNLQRLGRLSLLRPPRDSRGKGRGLLLLLRKLLLMLLLLLLLLLLPLCFLSPRGSPFGRGYGYCLCVCAGVNEWV